MMKGHLIIFILMLPGMVYSQDLANIGSENPVKISGSFNATGIGYAAYGILARRDPFNWFLNGGLNISLYGWSLPFSFNYSNQDRSFRQPFNQYGVAPEYRWVKGYLGYNSMTFSKYSLSGHIFMGAGVELTPGKFRMSLMYGRLNKATEGDSLSRHDPVFQRMGYGIKVGFADKQDAVDLILFKAKDDPSSLHYFNQLPDDLKPEENLVVSLIGRKGITERIFLSAEYAISGVTRDIAAEEKSEKTEGVYKLLNWGLKERTTTNYYKAFNTGVNYNGNFYTVNLNFERIDPGYNTLGAYYFNNDIQNLTVGGNVRLLKQKLNLNANAGTQKNNLDDTELSQTKRGITSFNVSYMPSQKWNINAGYSNFTTFTNIRPRLDPFFEDALDTLNFYQINKNANTTLSYTFGPKENKQSIFLTGSYQVSGDEQEGEEATNTSFIMGNLAYRFTFNPLNTTVSVSANVNRNDMPGFKTFAFGPNARLSRTFFNKSLRTSFSGTFNAVRTNEMVNSKVMNFRLSGSYTVKKQHALNLFMNMLRKFGTEQNSQQFNEFTGTVSYSYSF